MLKGNEIIEKFKTTKLFKMYENTLNAPDENSINLYHEEKTVAEHILMVANVCINEFKDDPEFEDLLLACLLHDAGKPFSREIIEGRARFFGHEAQGVYFIKDVLDMFDVKGESLEKLVFAVAHHDLYKYDNKKAKRRLGKYGNFIKKLMYCDAKGRITKIPKEDPKVYLEYEFDDVDEHISDKPQLIFLIGLPCSGKSTYCETFANANIISRDYFVMNNPFIDSGDYKTNWKYLLDNDLHGEIDKLYDARLKKLAKEGKDIVIDKVNMSKNSRGLELKGYSKTAIFILDEYDNIVEREKKRGKVGLGTLEKFMKTFTFPSYAEFDRILITDIREIFVV